MGLTNQLNLIGRAASSVKLVKNTEFTFFSLVLMYINILKNFPV